MICQQCGREWKTDGKYCPYCGAAAEKPHGAQSVTPHIVLGEDGVYRWTYAMSLFRNPTVFLLIWKIFFFVFLGIFAFMILLTGIEDGFQAETVLSFLRFGGIFLLGMTALCLIGYLLYAAIMGGKYIVQFEMDETGVNHKQIDKQAKKAAGIAEAAMIAGALAGSRGAVSAGATARTEMYSEFARVRKVRLYPRRHLIKVNQLLNKNQVYAAPEDYAFVRDYILRHVPATARSKKIK